MGNLGDVLNKAHLFDNDIKTKGQLSIAKIIPILVKFILKMEAALVDIWKLVSGSLTGPSQPLLLLAMPQKEKHVKELRTLLQQRLIKDVIIEVAKIEVPSAAILAATPIVKVKKIEKDTETKTTSSKPSSQRKSARKKTKEPSLEFKVEEESKEGTESSGGNAESEEEDEPATPPLEKKKRMDTRALDKKKLASTFKTSIAPKWPMKSPRKGKSSQKKPRRK